MAERAGDDAGAQSVAVVAVAAAAADVATCTQTMKGNHKPYGKREGTDEDVPARIPQHDAGPPFPCQYSSTDTKYPHLFP